MIENKSWEEFRKAGLLWWINMVLHTFGWAIVYDYDENKNLTVLPARVKFRGFDNDINSNGYIKISKYLKDNITEIEKESKE